MKLINEDILILLLSISLGFAPGILSELVNSTNIGSVLSCHGVCTDVTEFESYTKDNCHGPQNYMKLKENLDDDPSDFWPYVSNVSFPFNTTGPINFNSSSARFVFTKDPLRITNALFSNFSIVNNGLDLEIRLNQPYNYTGAQLTGGVLFNKVNLMTNSNRRHAELANYASWRTPLLAYGFYYNQEYGSFEDAVNYRDGVVNAQFYVNVKENQTNPYFPIFADLLRQVIEPGTSVTAPSFATYFWLDNGPKTLYYYSYPSSYRTNTCGTGKGTLHFCSTEIVVPLEFSPTISEVQFNEFLALKSTKKRAFGSTVRGSSQRQIPVVKAWGEVQNLVLF